MTASTPPGRPASDTGSDASPVWMRQRERGSLAAAQR